MSPSSSGSGKHGISAATDQTGTQKQGELRKRRPTAMLVPTSSSRTYWPAQPTWSLGLDPPSPRSPIVSERRSGRHRLSTANVAKALEGLNTSKDQQEEFCTEKGSDPSQSTRRTSLSPSPLPDWRLMSPAPSVSSICSLADVAKVQLRAPAYTLQMLQICAALQTFCNSLISADVPAFMLEVLGNDAAAYTHWSMWQNGTEQLFELLMTSASCALSDSCGRRPVLLLTGPLQLCLWALAGAFLPRRSTLKPVVAVTKAMASVSNSAFLAVSSTAICDFVRCDTEKLADSAAVSQSYVGLSVVLAPLLSVYLRSRFGPRAPFVVAAVLSGASLIVLQRNFVETLSSGAFSQLRIHALNPFSSSTLLFRQGANVALPALMYSAQTLTRCVDPYLQPFMERVLGWGRNEVAQLLSFWGLCVFVGSRGLKRALRRFSAKSVILVGTLCNSLDFMLRATTTSWWHHPAALVVGLPGISVEAAMRGLVTNLTNVNCPHLGKGAVQAALKTQQTLTLALVGSPVFARAFTWWLGRPPPKRGAMPLAIFPAAHYMLASLAGIIAHVLLWAI